MQQQKKQNSFVLKEVLKDSFGLEEVHRWDPFLVLPPSG